MPPVNEGSVKLNPPADQMDSDLDAEGEEETDLYEMDQQLQNAVHRSYTGEEAEDNRGGAVDDVISRIGKRIRVNGGDIDETEFVGAVKVPEAEESSDEDSATGTADADGDPAFEDDVDNESGASPTDSTGSESDDQEDWEAESNGHDDADVDIRSRANCM